MGLDPEMGRARRTPHLGLEVASSPGARSRGRASQGRSASRSPPSSTKSLTTTATPPGPRSPASQRAKPVLRTRMRSRRRSPSGHGRSAPSTSSSPGSRPQARLEGDGTSRAAQRVVARRRQLRPLPQASTTAAAARAGSCRERTCSRAARPWPAAGRGRRAGRAGGPRAPRAPPLPAARAGAISARQVGELGVVGDDRRPARGEHAQQRGRGLAGRGIAKVEAEIDGGDGGLEVLERQEAGDVDAVRHPGPPRLALEIHHRRRLARRSPGGPASSPGARERPHGRDGALDRRLETEGAEHRRGPAGRPKRRRSARPAASSAAGGRGIAHRHGPHRHADLLLGEKLRRPLAVHEHAALAAQQGAVGRQLEDAARPPRRSSAWPAPRPRRSSRGRG